MTKLFFFFFFGHLRGRKRREARIATIPYFRELKLQGIPPFFYRLKLTFMMEKSPAGQQSFDLCVKEESNRVKVSPEGNYSLAAQARSSLSLLRLILR